MRLTTSQARAVVESAAAQNIPTEDPEQTVQEAFEAIMSGAANEAAYLVTEAAGVEWITPSIWARTQEAMPRMKASTAREIIKQALEDESWEGEEPEDDKKAIEIATELVEMAQDAWDQNVQGPEVEALLKIAARDEDGDEDDAPAAKKSAAKSRPSPRKKTEPEPEPEEDEDERASTEPWEGYKTDTASDIMDGLEVWIDEGENDAVEHVLVYESANKNRKRIVERCKEALGTSDDAEPEAEPEPEPEDDSAPETVEEPFEDYGTLKASEVRQAMEEYLENDEVDDGDKLETLEQVIAYESANKNRTTLLDQLEGFLSNYKESQDGEEEPSSEEEGEGSEEDPAPSEADEEPASGSSQSKSRGKGSGVSTRARSRSDDKSSDSDAGSSYVVTSAGGEIEITLDGKHAALGAVLDLLEAGATSVSIDVG